MGQPGEGRAGQAAPAELVAPLEELGRADLERAGGKGANLGELVRGGFPVPAGFVVTTAAYDRFIRENALAGAIAAALASGAAAPTGPDPGSAGAGLDAERGAALRAALLGAPVPAEVASAVIAAYRALGRGPVAVRSSATTEDLPGAAFAGQHDTFLNVAGDEELLAAVKGCWASLWTDRAVAYRARVGMGGRAARLAVVVQRMVAADAAGVMFTANPVTGARDEVVVDAAPGLGEAVVAGLVTPDHHVLRRRLGRGWRVVESRLGRREVVVRPRAGGGVEHVAGAAAGAQALPNAALRELGRLGAAIALRFGGPQDVEWAWADGRLFVVQSRPITALPEPLLGPGRGRAGRVRPGRGVRLAAGIVAEMLPSRPYPLEASTWGFERIFVELLGPLLRTAGMAIDLEGLFLEEEGVIVRYTGQLPFRPTPAVALAPFRLARLARRYDPAAWRSDPRLAEFLGRVRELDRREVRELAWSDLLEMVHDALDAPRLVGELRVRYLIPRALDVAGLRLLSGLLGAGDRFGALLLTGVETKTLEANRALERLAQRIRAQPRLAALFAARAPDDLWAALEAEPGGQAFLAELRAFLGEYGHREVGGTVQVSKPTWREAPAVVLGILKGLAQEELRSRRARPAWEAVRDELLARPVMRRVPGLRAAFERLLARARYFPAIREDTRFYATMMLPSLRGALLELGRRLEQAGVLPASEDVFHLKLGELEALAGWPPTPGEAAALRETVARRSAKRAALEGTPLVDPRFLRLEAVEADVLLRGAPGSPGVAEGRVRVVRDGTEFGTLRDGEVLVAPFTNPAWTPLFERAAAVVVDSGGSASHAAIVAREYGIPAVMATADGTRRLEDGMRVRVDGTRGLVLAVDGEPG